MLIFRLTKCNKMNNHVHIAHHQGSFIVRKSNCVIVTVHDIGTSHQSLLSFCSLPCIKAVAQRSLIVHVCLPGQEPQAEKLDGQYPSMQVKQQFLQFFQIRRLCVCGTYQYLPPDHHLYTLSLVTSVLLRSAKLHGV